MHNISTLDNSVVSGIVQAVRRVLQYHQPSEGLFKLLVLPLMVR